MKSPLFPLGTASIPVIPAKSNRMSPHSAVEVDQARAFLAEIAPNIEARLEAKAKNLSHSEPDVAAKGGIERLGRLRDELSAMAAGWSLKLPDAVGGIDWRIHLGYAKKSAEAVLSPLEPLANEASDILTRFGFTGRAATSSRSWGRLVDPTTFLGPSDVSVLVPVLQRWVDALERSKKAQTADAASQVDEFWSWAAQGGAH